MSISSLKPKQLLNPIKGQLQKTKAVLTGDFDLYKKGAMNTFDGLGLFANPPPIPDPEAPPSPIATTEAASMSARDRIRRQAYRAQGRASTIKVSPTASLFSGQPKQLLGS